MSQVFLTIFINMQMWMIGGQIHRLHLFPFHGFPVHSLVHKNREQPLLFCNTYFHKESTFFEKSAETSSFFTNTALYPGNESTLWVHSQSTVVGSVVTTGIVHLIILNTGSGLSLMYVDQQEYLARNQIIGKYCRQIWQPNCQLFMLQEDMDKI
jgi:hypothetical protein